MESAVRVLSSLLVIGGLSAAAESPQITLEVKDYITMPITGVLDGKGTTNSLLARINFLREEPGGGKGRLFINDLNGPLYILNKASRSLTTYLDFNGREGHTGIFHKFSYETGYGAGLINFLFDPDYAQNGKFYTIHLEDPSLPVSALPDNATFPGFKTTGYTATDAIRTPGEIQREAVLIEWTDTNPSNSTFEGTAREIMRVQLNTRIHPMGDFIFNPTARAGDADWRVLYIACGDGGAGEQKTAIRSNPQRLDTMVGKILRIIPGTEDRKDSSTLSENGRYRIPNDNPFVVRFSSSTTVRKEIWAYGLRNPSRLSWDVDPSSPRNNNLIATVVGLHTWETVVIIHKGANYGYSLREGNQTLDEENKLGPLPEDDRIPVRINETTTDGMTIPTYPVVEYAHVKGGGDAAGSGYVYRGKAIPALRGKYLFGDISTGNLWYVDYKEMLAADNSHPPKMAALHEIKVLWNKSSGANELYSSMAPITESVYHARGGAAAGLPGSASVSGGRSDVHFAVDADGELYILSKSDGVVRAVVGATSK
jgi:hypothetical protein